MQQRDRSLPSALQTERLILRRWKATDLEPFAQLNADDDVMQFFPAKLDRQQSKKMIERIEKCFDEEGLGLWAVEEKASHSFIGFVGLNRPKFESHFTPCVEIGWRLYKTFWGKGYATEAAKEAIRDGFERLGLEQIVSFTAAINLPSIKVMERLGMTRQNGGDFFHPNVDENSPLRLHVLYRLANN